MGTLIDTSVWIDAFHPKTPVAIKAIAVAKIKSAEAVLCEPIHVEFFRGVPEREMVKMNKYLSTVPMLSTPPSLWKDAIPIIRKCTKEGVRVNILDVLIAVIALEHDATIITFDRDFLVLQEHCGVAVEWLTRPE